MKEKILDGFEFKNHIDKAAELNPGDHITHHLLGRFCYEVSQVCVKDWSIFLNLDFMLSFFNFILPLSPFTRVK